MGSKRALKRDLPDSYAQSGLRIITLVKGPFRGKSKPWPASLVRRNALNRGNTVFTWLNAAATIRHVLKIDAATIQRRSLFEGGVYYTLST